MAGSPAAMLSHANATGPHVGLMQPTAVHDGTATQLVDYLSEAYGAYREALLDPCYESMKARVTAVMAHLQSKGLCGPASVQLLAANRQRVNWEDMGLDAFSCFYRFVFLLCREPGKRNMQVGTAVQAWQLMLRGRFRLLDKWCSFISDSQCHIITEDTWRQVLDFSRTVHEDLSNYDPSGAWPVLLDDFVDELRSQRGRAREEAATCPQALLQAWSGLATARMTPMSPHSGSKRKAPDVEAVADQLQQMPLVSAGSGGSDMQKDDSSSQQQAGGGLRPTPLSAKRHRTLFGASSPSARGSSIGGTSAAASGGSASSPMSLSPCGGAGAMAAAPSDPLPPQRSLAQLPHQLLAAHSAGLPQRHSHVPLPGATPMFMQHQQQLLNNGNGSGYAALHPQALLQHGDGGCGTRGFDSGFALCSGGINAMMQVTVNEALGLN